MNRRRFVTALGAVTSAAIFSSRTRASAWASPTTSNADVVAAKTTLRTIEVSPGLRIVSREVWGGDIAPRRTLRTESDVKFLLVHHTAGPSSYSKQQVPQMLRNIVLFHQSETKRWPDTCYNFFVDQFGGVWEGRTGSLESPIRADATGGSQGFAQLVCLVGNFEDDVPSEEMVDALANLLGWLAHRYNIELRQSKRVTFTSRGSNKYPRGAIVRARPISGHRDVSHTACPGKNAYPLLQKTVPKKARDFQISLGRN